MFYQKPAETESICPPVSSRLREDLDSTTSHLLYISLGNFVCRQVRSSPFPEQFCVYALIKK